MNTKAMKTRVVRGQWWMVPWLSCALLLFFADRAVALSPVGIVSNSPVRVEVSIFIIDIDGIDTVDQSFEANVFLEASWHDASLAHRGPRPEVRPLSAVWNPQLQIVNQQKTWPTFPEVVTVTPEGDVTYRQRVWGSFSQPLALQDFPFDRQQFNIQLVAVGFTPEQVELVSDSGRKTGMAAKLSEPDWNISGGRTAAGVYEPIPGRGGPPAFTFSFDARRKQNYYLIKVVIPLVLIVMMSWVAFWIDPADSGIDISVAVTSMLTLIAYRFAIGTFLPVISYLTRLDFFILASTLLVFFSLVEVVVTSTLARRRRKELALTIDRVARWAFPVAFGYLYLQTLHLPLSGGT